MPPYVAKNAPVRVGARGGRHPRSLRRTGHPEKEQPQRAQRNTAILFRTEVSHPKLPRESHPTSQRTLRKGGASEMCPRGSQGENASRLGSLRECRDPSTP